MPGAPFTPMLATPGPLPTGPGWGYELKWDGVRAFAACAADGGVRLFGRRGNDVTVAYPDLANLGRLGRDALLDGEVVVLDAGGRPNFRDLAERFHVRDPLRAARLATTMPVTYIAFDLLRLDGVELTGSSYTRRRAALEALELPGRAMVSPVFDDGPATMAASLENGIEGVVAKRLTAGYRPGLRTADWVKVKHERTGDFVVGGYRPGVRALGAMLVGVPGPGGLAFRGRVGGGISAASERELLDLLRPLATTVSPFAGAIPREDSRNAVWVAPEVVVELRFAERTRDLRLRFPRLHRLRPDKPPADVTDEVTNA